MAERVVIFGGTGGMGSAIARRLQARGAELHLVGRDEGKLSALAEELGASQTVGDVTDPSLFEQVAEDAGKELTGLVYAVGTITLGRLKRLTSEQFSRDFQINALGAALAVQALQPALRKGQGAVVLFSTVAATQGFDLHTSIGMAKGAVNGLTLSLAAELAPHIRVNAIAPSLTKTPLAEGILSSERIEEAITGLHPLQRLGTADDMAAMATFLLSEEAGWMTGQIIGVDGGRSSLRGKG